MISFSKNVGPKKTSKFLISNLMWFLWDAKNCAKHAIFCQKKGLQKKRKKDCGFYRYFANSKIVIFISRSVDIVITTLEKSLFNHAIIEFLSKLCMQCAKIWPNICQNKFFKCFSKSFWPKVSLRQSDCLVVCMFLFFKILDFGSYLKEKVLKIRLF